MSQATANIANMSRTLYRGAVNSIVQAIQTKNSGLAEPTETWPYMEWADQTSGKIKRRNAANNAWIDDVPMATGAAIDAQTHAATAKTALVAADEFGFWDSVSSALRKITWANVQATLKTYFDTLYLPIGASSKQIQQISASVASNALTISASAISLDFRSTTLTSGTVTTVSGTPANLVVSSGSTLGTINATQSRLVVLALNNAGTIELAVMNIAGGNDLSETGLISTTAEGGAGAADSANVIYSATARTSVAYRVIGYIESTQATAGTWATAPSTIQGAGGQAVTAMSSLGYGQTLQNVIGSRISGTTYYNTTGKPIICMIKNGGGNSASLQFSINGIDVFYTTVSSIVVNNSLCIPVPPGFSYSCTATTNAISSWYELR